MILKVILVLHSLVFSNKVFSSEPVERDSIEHHWQRTHSTVLQSILTNSSKGSELLDPRQLQSSVMKEWFRFGDSQFVAQDKNQSSESIGTLSG